jgi:hypothetical protein
MVKVCVFAVCFQTLALILSFVIRLPMGLAIRKCTSGFPSHPTHPYLSPKPVDLIGRFGRIIRIDTLQSPWGKQYRDRFHASLHLKYYLLLPRVQSYTLVMNCEYVFLLIYCR